MLTKHKAKDIRALHEKKRRQETGLFLVEGEKSVAELLASDFAIDYLLVTQSFFDAHKELIARKKCEYAVVEQQEIENLGTLESNDAALAVAFQKKHSADAIKNSGIILALDGIRDPGNLGTIIRTADWFGIDTIVASPDSVDAYNPKVIAATKGSFARVRVVYQDLAEYLQGSGLPVFGAALNGEAIHSVSFPKDGILLMGSESHGISSSLQKFIMHAVTIPRYNPKTESLNVAIATGIILHAWVQT